MYHGIINVYKEKGMTSFDVVAALRRICGQKKVGHTGTLDPDAEGVLPVCLGKATRVSPFLSERGKAYRAVLRLGVSTDTQDLTGEVQKQRSTEGVTPQQVEAVIHSFVGVQEQIPPMYSAKKVDGKRLYDLAREGITVERKPETIEIFQIDILETNLPDVTIQVACSKGTYIRTLCHDIGEKLGCGGAMASLLRTEAAGFSLQDAHKLDEIRQFQEEDRLAEIIRPIRDVFSDLPEGRTPQAYDSLLKNGSKLPADAFVFREPDPAGDFCAHTSDGTFVGLYRYSPEEGIYRARRIFYIGD